ncbi:hypothetical protein XELAEV_180015393mg, partial [Xenopus laevis]
APVDDITARRVSSSTFSRAFKLPMRMSLYVEIAVL